MFSKKNVQIKRQFGDQVIWKATAKVSGSPHKGQIPWKTRGSLKSLAHHFGATFWGMPMFMVAWTGDGTVIFTVRGH